VAVAYPKSTEEAAEIARICYKYNVPMSELFSRESTSQQAKGEQFHIQVAQVWRGTLVRRLVESVLISCI
jgi:FAD/FMN-containing dehydrogenase